jgi:hypothetical protein
MLKTTSGYSPRTDLSSNTTFSQSQSQVTVPLSPPRVTDSRKLPVAVPNIQYYVICSDVLSTYVHEKSWTILTSLVGTA